MDVTRKIIQTALLVQDFFHKFQGADRGGSPGAELYEPPNLPVWMRHAAQYGRFPFHSPSGQVLVTLIIPKPTTTFEQTASLYSVFEKMGSGPALILADELSPKARAVLVRMGIPHVTSGGAIYAPHLGLSYGRLRAATSERETRETLSGVGLKLTAAYILHPNLFENAPSLSELHHRLARESYAISVATISRAVQQLQELKLVEVTGNGPHKRMRFMDRAQTWTRLLGISVETVMRRVETMYLPADHSDMCVLTGDSALAKLSDLAEPKVLTVAMSVAHFRQWKETRDKAWADKDQAVGDFGNPPTIIELWREDPLFLADRECINAVELALSLRTTPDERVHLALADILKSRGLDPEPLWRPS